MSLLRRCDGSLALELADQVRRRCMPRSIIRLLSEAFLALALLRLSVLRCRTKVCARLLRHSRLVFTPIQLVTLDFGADATLVRLSCVGFGAVATFVRADQVPLPRLSYKLVTSLPPLKPVPTNVIRAVDLCPLGFELRSQNFFYLR